MSGKDLTLALKIKALVEGVKDVLGLKQGIGGVRKESEKKIPDPTPKLRDGMSQSQVLARDLKTQIGALFSLAALGRGVSASVNAIRRYESAFRGLEAVANYTAVGIEQAWTKATELSADGLLIVADSAKALQNLLSRGYSIDEAVTTIVRLKDAAAFNRAAHLSLSEAVVTATEGLKNENSVLVDNAGVTKNVSVLWKEYADEIGKTVSQLSQQEKIQAEVNGIMRETAGQVGNAAKAAAGAEGKIAEYQKSTEELATSLGDTLIPALTTLAEWGTQINEKVFKPGIAYVQSYTTYFAALHKSIADGFSGDFDQISKNFEWAREESDKYHEAARTNTVTITKQIKDNIDQQAVADRKRAQEEVDRKRALEEELKLLDSRVALSRAYFDNEARIAQDAIEGHVAALDRQLDSILISYGDYYGRRQALAEQSIDAEIKSSRQALDAQRQALAQTKEEKDQLSIKASIAALEAELAILVRRRGEVGVQAAHDQAKAERELQDELELLRIRLLEAQGQNGEARTRALEAEFRDLIARLKVEGDTEGQALVQKLFNIETARAQLTSLQDLYSRTMTDMNLQEQTITAQREAGIISEINARRQVVDLHRQTYEAVSELVPKMMELAVATSDPVAIQRIKQLMKEIEQLGIVIDETAVRVNDMIEGGLADAFSEVGRSINSVEDFFDSFVQSAVRGLQRIAAEALASQIFSMFGGSAFGAAVSAAINHAGGIGGSGGRREVSLLAFMNAPRYHSGNARELLGLKPGEVPAVINQDEEVLTRSNPRHILNQGQQGGGDLTLRAIFVQDQRDVGDYMNSSAGEKTFVQVVERNKSTFQRILGIRS